MADRSFPDQNLRNSLIVVSSADGVTPVSLWADPSTHALVTSGGGSGGGGTQYTSGGAAVTNPTGNSLIYFNGSNVPVAVTSANPLPITGTISVGSTTDESAFTAGTSTLSPSGGVFNDSVASLSSGQQGTVRMTAPRAIHINLRNNTGTEIGTAATPVQVSLANTGTNATGVTVIQGTAAAVGAGWPVIGGELADTTGTFTNATQTTSVTSTNFDGYSTVIVSINGTYGTATAVFEVSDDGGTTWYSVNAARTDGSAVETGYTTLTNTNRMWTLSVSGADEFRVRSTAVASGTVNVRLSVESMPTPEAASVSAYQATAANLNATVVGTGAFSTQVTSLPTLPAGTNVIGHVIADSGSTTIVTGTVAVTESGTWNVGSSSATGSTVPANAFYLGAQNSAGNLSGLLDIEQSADGSNGLGTLGVSARIYNGSTWDRQRGTGGSANVNLNPQASGGWTPYFANAITTTVAPTAAAGKFGGYMLINLNSTPAYLQVFDTTGAVTLGSTAPTFVIPIPANATAANGLAANVELANGIVIANGIKCAATTTSNGATTVTTGLTGTLWVK